VALRLAPRLPSARAALDSSEHHKSRLNSCLTAISFPSPRSWSSTSACWVRSPSSIISRPKLFGIAGWYIGYLVINSFSHANFELKSKDYNRWLGKVLTSTTYHSLHHSRYTGNYGSAPAF
jgi:sterol desaturase/sphingolipid hydroxylase (fatty acid hydroxylase superfamily)